MVVMTMMTMAAMIMSYVIRYVSMQIINAPVIADSITGAPLSAFDGGGGSGLCACDASRIFDHSSFSVNPATIHGRTIVAIFPM